MPCTSSPTAARGSNPTFIEDCPVVSLYTGASVSTVESGQTIAGMTLTVTNAADNSGADEVLVFDGTDIALNNTNNRWVTITALTDSGGSPSASLSVSSTVTVVDNSISPTVTTQAASSVGTTTATGNGNITHLGVPNPTQHVV